MSQLAIDGRIALITGGARGIGLETARALHARGVGVALLDIDEREAREAASALGARAIGIGADVADETSVRLAVEAAVTELGGVDIVVANAGIAQPVRPVSVVDRDAFDRTLAVNLNGVVHTVRQTLPQVIERRGHVAVIASVYAFVNGSMQSSYAMSKAAVEQLGRALRVELAPHGASAGVAYFGFVETDLVRGVMSDPLANRAEEIAPRALRKRILPAEAAAALVAGIEHRAARTVLPRRWTAYFRLRGLLGPPIDEYLVRSPEVGALIGDAERSERGAA